VLSNMDPAVLDEIATKAENELPVGAKFGVFIATDKDGVDVEVIARVIGTGETGKPQVKLVGAYHLDLEVMPGEQRENKVGVKIVGVI
jgi:hypothetical protein